jgi:hypothetical protein
MSRFTLEIAIGAYTKYGCINKVIENPLKDIGSDTLLELWLDNTFEIIKTEVLNDFRDKKERNYIQISECEVEDGKR